MVEAPLTIFYYSKRVVNEFRRVAGFLRSTIMVKFALISCQQRKHEREIYYSKLIFTILKPGFINGLSKLCLLWCQVVMYFEKFQTHEQQDADFRMCWSSHSA